LHGRGVTAGGHELAQPRQIGVDHLVIARQQEHRVPFGDQWSVSPGFFRREPGASPQVRSVDPLVQRPAGVTAAAVSCGQLRRYLNRGGLRRRMCVLRGPKLKPSSRSTTTTPGRSLPRRPTNTGRCPASWPRTGWQTQPDPTLSARRQASPRTTADARRHARCSLDRPAPPRGAAGLDAAGC
jgi:hypothetical protein